MVEVQIKALQNELNHLIDKGCNFTEVYELSVKLDELILEYYNKWNNIEA